MNKRFIKTPLVGVQVNNAKDVGTRTVNLLMGEHAGEYVRGDIMDANAVIQAFDEIKGSVDTDHDSLAEIVDEINNLRNTTDQSFETFQQNVEEETANRIQGDNTLDEKIDQKERESNERDNVLQQNINTEKQERVNDDTQLRNDLTAEVNRAKASENTLSSDIQAEATKRENDDNTIKDNLNAEVTRATAKENEIKAEVDVINGDSNTEGSFRKAIADVIAAAPEDLDTLKEIADKLADNDDLHTALNQAITEKADASALANEVTRATAAEATLQNSFDQFVSKTATKEQFGVVKVGDGLNVNAGVISIAPDYLVDMMSYGVEWDVTVADPTCTRIGNPLFHKSLPIQSEYKGCVVKNGKLQYYLNPNDWTKTSNGSNSNLDGTDGDVMIHTPKFYGKSGSNGNKRWVRISTVKVDASWVEIPEMFISAYRNTIYTDGDTTKIASVVSTDAKYRGGGRRSEYDQYLDTDQFKTDLGKPVSNISRATMRTYAEATGQELLCYEFYKWIFYWNYVIEYANFNSQKEFNSELTSDGYHQGGLGPGLTTWDWGSWNTYNGNYAITPCGYTNEFGNFSGVKAIQLQSPVKTLYANRWRGFENPFGDIWTNLEGIVIKRNVARANSNVYTTTDILKYGEDYSLFDIAGIEIAKDGLIKTFDLGSKAEIIPSYISRSESTYKCDYHWCGDDSVENRTLRVGGGAGNGGSAGLGCFASAFGVGSATALVGFRSLVRI